MLSLSWTILWLSRFWYNSSSLALLEIFWIYIFHCWWIDKDSKRYLSKKGNLKIYRAGVKYIWIFCFSEDASSSKIILDKSSIYSTLFTTRRKQGFTIIYPPPYFWISMFPLCTRHRNSLSLYVPRTISADSELENVIKSTRAFTRGHGSVPKDAIFIDPLFIEISLSFPRFCISTSIQTMPFSIASPSYDVANCETVEWNLCYNGDSTA